MTFPQTMQTYGFFWLAATGLFLSVERINWTLTDFVAPLCALSVYLIGRSHQHWYQRYNPSQAILIIGASAVGSGALIGADAPSAAASTSILSLIVGGSVCLMLGSKLRRDKETKA